jgi:hypothetical protein
VKNETTPPSQCFFAVDRSAWAKVCDLGSMNAAVAYLVMARGALKDHRTTSWSTNAIEGRTDISRLRARAAIQALIGNLVRQDEGGKRPRYYLLPDGDNEPEWIWLPDALVDAAAGETSPVELVREAADVWALRLLVDLYFEQSLQFDGGVHWRKIRQRYLREKVGERGEYIIWGFSEGLIAVWQEKIAKPFLTGKSDRYEVNGVKQTRDSGLTSFWKSLTTLHDLGLFRFIGHLINSDTDDGEVMHPCAMTYGEPGECDIASAAHQAARSMLTDWQRAKSRDLMLVPVKKHIADVQLVGLLRLTYRAQTSATSAWFQPQEWGKMAEDYRVLGGQKSLSHQSRITT